MTAASKRWVALSPFVLPELRLGHVVVSAQNLSDGTQRLEYLEGARAFLEGAAATGLPEARRQALRLEVPFADMLIKEQVSDGQVSYRLIRDAVDMLHFRHDQLRVLLADGRKRRSDEMLAYETGEMTAGFGRVLSALTRGVPQGDLLELAARVGVELDEDFLDEWRAAGVIDEVEPGLSRVPERLRRGDGDRLTWLGHAAVMFQAPDATVLVDPFLQPRIAWRDAELAEVFSPGYADARLFSPYDASCAQLSVHGLPAPDAVLVTHQDSDHFSLGALMVLPEATTIVVPRADPARRPWELDLREVIHRVLGPERKVVALGHGESLRFGGVTVTAFPFVGEYPAMLPHSWNGYLVETERSAAIFGADAALTQQTTDWLEARLAPGRRPAVLLARTIHWFDEPGTATQRGYRDANDELYPVVRLWPWFTTVQALFEPAEVLGISAYNLRRLARGAGVKHFFPYALGSAPWFRFAGSDNYFAPKVASLDAGAFAAECEKAAAVGAAVPALRYGEPLRLA
jgi:L-ascorbate metabolism protein UlaG (beta-lactamase superfamily)